MSIALTSDKTFISLTQKLLLLTRERTRGLERRSRRFSSPSRRRTSTSNDQLQPQQWLPTPASGITPKRPSTLEPSSVGPGSHPIAQPVPQGREQLVQILNRSMAHHPTSSNVGPNLRWVAQRARRNREQGMHLQLIHLQVTTCVQLHTGRDENANGRNEQDKTQMGH